MKSTWRVRRVEATETATTATLVRTEWFRRNPAYDAAVSAFSVQSVREGRADDEFPASLPARRVPAEPGEDGADVLFKEEEVLVLKLDEPWLWSPGDDLVMELWAR